MSSSNASINRSTQQPRCLALSALRAPAAAYLSRYLPAMSLSDERGEKTWSCIA
jgi:hypothetical protein